jgi:GNAT superfamily N-acetyltransferase
MPQIEIRTALATDIPYLPKIDHHSVSETVWKMAWAENGGLGATFQPAPLPRPLKLPYPHDPQKLLDTWQRRGLLLVAVHDGLPIGYLAAEPGRPQHGLWLTDVVVHAPWRRKGIGSALVLTAGEWGSERGLHQMVLEASSAMARRSHSPSTSALPSAASNTAITPTATSRCSLPSR